MAKVMITDLLEAGCHFGHQTKRWNPKMKDFVYGAKNGISIIDLTKTMRQIADACNFLQHQVTDGGTVLFVGTKRQAQQIIFEAAEKTGMAYVSERWLGGTLTNNVTIRKSISRMNNIEKMLASDESGKLKKKEISALTRNLGKLHRDLDGIAAMKKMPDVLVVVDVCHDDIAVREAAKLKIPIVAIVDTNGNPQNIDYPVAANDDAVKSIKIIMDVFVDAICVANEIYKKKVVEEKAAREAADKAARDEKLAREKERDEKRKTVKKAPAQKTETDKPEVAAAQEAKVAAAESVKETEEKPAAAVADKETDAAPKTAKKKTAKPDAAPAEVKESAAAEKTAKKPARKKTAKPEAEAGHQE